MIGGDQRQARRPGGRSRATLELSPDSPGERSRAESSPLYYEIAPKQVLAKPGSGSFQTVPFQEVLLGS